MQSFFFLPSTLGAVRSRSNQKLIPLLVSLPPTHWAGAGTVPSLAEAHILLFLVLFRGFFPKLGDKALTSTG